LRDSFLLIISPDKSGSCGVMIEHEMLMNYSG